MQTIWASLYRDSWHVFVVFFSTFLLRLCALDVLLKTAAVLTDGSAKAAKCSHWLPVQQRLVFKIAILVHRNLSGNDPVYLADDCLLVADARVRQLHAADTGTLIVSRTRSRFGDRTFATTEPQVRNSLPPNVRLCGLSYGQFGWLLKTILFGEWGLGTVWTVFVTTTNRNILTYICK